MSKKVLHIGQLIGGLDVYIRNSISCSDGDFDFVIAHGKTDKSEPVLFRNRVVKEYETDLQRDLSPIKDLKALTQIIQICRREKPDIIHCHSAKGGVVGRITGWLTGTPVLYTPHAFSFLSFNGIKSKIFKWIERNTKFTSHLLACSESERLLGIDDVGYNDEKALLWSNSVPDGSLALIEIENKYGPFICYIGRPSYQKNMRLLVDVATEVHKICTNVKFLLLGVGYYSPNLEELENLLKERNLEDVFTLMPWLSHEETLGYLKKSLFYLTTSRYEGLPLSVIEAMCLSKPIVATDVTGNRDCVVNGFNGFIVKENAFELAESCITLINDESLRTEMGINSRTMYESTFNIERTIHHLSNIYEKYAKQNDSAKSISSVLN